ncbi:MAG: DEAD/DEAH box helicase [Chloroflexi bacterium]|nr:DEAD/DEAH box helicase [Chloroflexota bacterium]
MPSDVFALRDRVVDEYRDYAESFVNILDERIRQFVQERLDQGELWPEAILQLNPAYEPGPTLGELAARGVLARETARFFGPNLRLYRHQEEALEIAGRGEPYVVSTGTGSGKSLTYLVPIFDHVVRNQPERHSVRAIVVYPMNALTNSQLEALNRFRRSNWPGAPVTFARYTGQEREEERRRILDDPPHILLTNYVMLEYLLIRPYERALLAQATRELHFLVLDELHVYRGRQGADVAMLTRRLRQRAERELRCIGTSATIATAGSREERRARIAEVGTSLFGVSVEARSVVDETLRRVITVAAPRTAEELRAAVEASPPEPAQRSVTAHPLAAWVEESFGLDVENGRLVRRAPVAFKEGLDRLVRETGLPPALCQERLRAVLDAGNRAPTPSGEPVFAFRLHQFLSSGSSVFTTIEPPDRRLFTMEGQYAVPARGEERGEGDHDRRRLLYPLAFCRECGQEHYLVSLLEGGAAQRLDESGEELDNVVTRRLIPRSPLLNAAEDDTRGELGYFSPERDDLWSGLDEDLPEAWFDQLKAGPRLRRNYVPHRPRRVWARSDGAVFEEPVESAVGGWFQPRPLMLCLRCRAVYDLRERRDFGKLATLSQTGRSTATTIATCAAVVAMREDGQLEPEAHKVLSFTDNRQDASLQAGHLNDFVQVVLLRGALVRALDQQNPLGFDRVGQAAYEALAPRPEQFMREPVGSGPGYTSARQTMISLLEYRAFEDLRRAWRVAQPNLEQCGLLRLEYAGLSELATDSRLWSGAPVIANSAPGKREEVLRAVLDHLRGALAIDAECLTEDRVRQLTTQTRQWLGEPWAMDEFETLRRSAIGLLPGVVAARGEEARTLGLGSRSAVGRYLRFRHTWGIDRDLAGPEVEDLVQAIVAALRGQVLTVLRRQGEDYGVQIKAGALRWTSGAGQAPGPDPVRARSLYLRRRELLRTTPNRYFEQLYRGRAPRMVGIVGREHTGQVSADDRAEREKAFREGNLPALFCSPTMELGVDIADLAVVHLRNVPRTPANYAQRGGRAGRGGRPAFVVTFCAQGNAHDQYFFRRRDRMIAGSVAPPRMDLANRELVKAHLHSVWLGYLGLSLGSSLGELLDLDQGPPYPLLADRAAQLALSTERQREVLEAFREVVGSAAQPDWLTDEWLAETVRQAPVAFDQAFRRWRELYQAAIQQREAARRRMDSHRASRQERQEAEERELEARREIDLLLNRTGSVEESDFYPYRYLASEGFLPGYNFPRLPLRALVSNRDRVQAIDRPRFLGLSEFGPHNVIYHEGRKHRVTACVISSSGIIPRITRARICKRCGYIHPGERSGVDCCEHCGTGLDAATSDFPQALFDQPTAKASRWARITADEEERSREGYEITTQYRFAPGVSLRRVEVRAEGEEVLLEATYASQAELWRINHGWRRSRNGHGFTLDQETGRWRKPDDDEIGDDLSDSAARQPLTGIKPYVTDSRNVLLLRPMAPGSTSPFFATSLAYALQRGIQFVYQIEEQEVAVELIGQGAEQRLLLWEAAEGGTGVWERLIADRRGFAEVAAEALRVCHFDPAAGAELAGWAERCALACYDCLLSYSNQLEHRLINRHLVRDYLLRLARSEVVASTAGRSYDEQHRWLRERVDPASELEREFLDYLYHNRLRLPDLAQHRPEPDVPVQADFFANWEGRKGICAFVDGPSHDEPAQAARDREVRDELVDRGYRVVVVRYDRGVADQVSSYPDVFGTA